MLNSFRDAGPMKEASLELERIQERIPQMIRYNNTKYDWQVVAKLVIRDISHALEERRNNERKQI